ACLTYARHRRNRKSEEQLRLIAKRELISPLTTTNKRQTKTPKPTQKPKKITTKQIHTTTLDRQIKIN
ncbi:hypothetical protein, partial [Pseudomonas syringae group genomosp. 7]|uniref:hypothetical protein n=1 Tax=Pseudomonas syringae group genomosp. 7 TaxID=251699 RepID=UPI00376FB37C